MTTTHKIINANSSNIKEIPDKSINLIVTSPPYPMVEMWDDLFCSQDDNIKTALSNNGILAFSKMHDILDKTWKECDRVLSNNGFICINIGDATRTINDSFQIYSNHSRIINFFQNLGYDILPDIIWHKPSNAPNRFMGSGMLPAGAYVTYEHEYILVFRKGGKRNFNDSEKLLRQKSAYFWEERNNWFSDIWKINGTSQALKSEKSRTRNASYPVEIPYRLVNMYSIEGDTVLDPYCGMGTTNLACILSNRNSVGIEINEEISELALNRINIKPTIANDFIKERLNKHIEFIDGLTTEKREKCYLNNNYNFLVKTRQEINIKLPNLTNISKSGNIIICEE